MVRRGVVPVVVAMAAAVTAQTASADPTHAGSSLVVTAICGAQQVQLVANGSGTFTPGHDLAGTAVFVPTALDLTFALTPTGGTTEIETEVAAKHDQGQNPVTCQIPASLNTFTDPEGTVVLSGSATGFFTPAGR